MRVPCPLSYFILSKSVKTNDQREFGMFRLHLYVDDRTALISAFRVTTLLHQIASPDKLTSELTRVEFSDQKPVLYYLHAAL